jgi:hypothetical protein
VLVQVWMGTKPLLGDIYRFHLIEINVSHASSEIFPEKDIEDEDISEIAAARSQIESMQSRISELEDELELERNR